jgi:DNA polymerase-3 subunit beta
VDRVSTISTEKSRAVKLAIENGSLVLSATSPENGTAVEELEVRYLASPLEIGFNSRYLLDIAEQIQGTQDGEASFDQGIELLIEDQKVGAVYGALAAPAKAAQKAAAQLHRIDVEAAVG